LKNGNITPPPATPLAPATAPATAHSTSGNRTDRRGDRLTIHNTTNTRHRHSLTSTVYLRL
jgi:hypothetical protein